MKCNVPNCPLCSNPPSTAQNTYDVQIAYDQNGKPYYYYYDASFAAAFPSTVESEVKPLRDSIPGLNELVPCPAPLDDHASVFNGAHPLIAGEKICTGPDGLPIYTMVIHLNDQTTWTREKIADWLETLDADLTFKTPEEVQEEKKQKVAKLYSYGLSFPLPTFAQVPALTPIELKQLMVNSAWPTLDEINAQLIQQTQPEEEGES